MSRQETHFFDLDHQAEESSVDSFLESHPELSHNNRLSQVTKATIAGYLSHLATDELWISDIYRPFFGPASAFANDPLANLLDRALQHELEEKERNDISTLEDILSLLQGPLTVDDLGFIDVETLKQWQGFIYTLAKRQFKWENFNKWVEKIIMPREKLEAERMKYFLTDLPEMRQMAVERVTWQRLEAFMQQAVSSSVSLVEEYFQ